MNILLTGATGRLGLHVLNKLTEKRHKIRILLRSPADVNKLQAYPQVEVAYGDLTDKDTLSGITQNIDVVIHLAAIINYIAPESTLYRVNLEGTKNLISECAKTGIKKFIYASSTAVYGKKFPKEPITEDYPLRPNNAYGKSKMLAEKELLKFKEKMNIVILRMSMLYGRGFDTGYFYILKTIQNNNIRILGNGENRIPLLHVDDAVKSIVLALENNTESGSIYNVTNPESITQKQLIQMASKELEIDFKYKTIPVFLAKLLASIELIGSYLNTKEPKLLSEYIEKISCDRQFSIYKIQMELGFVPEIKIEKGMKEMVEYFLEEGDKE